MVITGESKGQKGRVLEVDRDKDRAIVEGVNMVSKHTKAKLESTTGRYYKKRSTDTYIKSDAY